MSDIDEREFLERRPRRTDQGMVEDIDYRPIAEARAAELLARIADSDRAPFYLGIASQMTVLMRATIWFPEEYSDGVARHRLRWANEMMHGLVQQIRLQYNHLPSLYTPQAFCQSMYEKARSGGFEEEFAINVMAPLLWSALRPRDNS
ncbi:MAG TPA: hypothetical protein VFH62_00190 [Dehalococcoidia bacterium]|nr:hypothetical protein [Dehalococcoidia bacterium]